MGKRNKDWNNVPFNPYVEADQKASEFDKQYEQNRDSGNAKEEAGQYRPEPEGRGSEGRTHRGK